MLHVCPVAELGGVESVLLTILRTLDRTKTEPIVVLLEDGSLVDDIRSLGVEVRVIRAGRVRDVRRMWGSGSELRRLIRSYDIDVVHSHNAKAHLYGGLAARSCGVPSVFHLHGVPRPAMSRDGIVSAASVAVPATKTLACSEYVAREFRAAWRSTRNIEVIHNAAEVVASNNHDRQQIREELGVSSEDLLIVMPTRLQRWKGVHVFLSAAAKLLSSRTDIRVAVVGGALFGLETDYLLDLKQQAHELGVHDSIVFTGFRRDVGRFFEAADLVVHSSVDPEPFGMVLIEAMAHGKAVVASNAGGPQEIVAPGETGVLVAPRSSEALSEAILSLLMDRRQLVSMGEAGRQRVRSHFSPTAMVHRLGKVYEGVLTQR